MDDYYNDATLQNKLHQISVPLLCLSAADDPFQPLDGKYFMKGVIFGRVAFNETKPPFLIWSFYI